MGAAGDCEAIGTGFLAQPVNSLTTIALIIAGFWVMWTRPDRRWIAAGLVATGVGSFLFHGPMPPGSEWAHDVTLAWLIVTVGVAGTRWERLGSWPALAAIGVLFAVWPVAADPVAVVLAAVAVVALLIRDRSSNTVAPLLVLGAGAIVGRLGATGWALCDPDSLLQTHGLWHIAAAVAVAWWAVGSPPGHHPHSRFVVRNVGDSATKRTTE